MKLEIRAIVRALGWLVLALVALPFGYLLAGQAGGMIPSNGDWRAPERGVVIFVESNGIHTGLVVPLVAEGVDWRDLVRPEHLPPDGRPGTWLSFGWGDRDFYVNTPTWAEVKVSTVIAAATGSDTTLVHVDHLAPPSSLPDRRPVVLSVAEYRRLAAYIRASFRLDEAGRSQPVRGYGAQDVFYVGTGRYSALHTCNAWVGDGLRHAGVRVGAWTPFPWTVMWWFERPMKYPPT